MQRFCLIWFSTISQCCSCRTANSCLRDTLERSLRFMPLSSVLLGKGPSRPKLVLSSSANSSKLSQSSFGLGFRCSAMAWTMSAARCAMHIHCVHVSQSLCLGTQRMVNIERQTGTCTFMFVHIYGSATHSVLRGTSCGGRSHLKCVAGCLIWD